jgi:hypothetical protein
LANPSRNPAASPSPTSSSLPLNFQSTTYNLQFTISSFYNLHLNLNLFSVPPPPPRPAIAFPPLTALNIAFLPPILRIFTSPGRRGSASVGGYHREHHPTPFTLLNSCGIRSTIRRNSPAPNVALNPARRTR